MDLTYNTLAASMMKIGLSNEQIVQQVTHLAAGRRYDSFAARTPQSINQAKGSSIRFPLMRSGLAVIVALLVTACGSGSGEEDCQIFCDTDGACERDPNLDVYSQDDCYASCKKEADISEDLGCSDEFDAMQECYVNNQSCIEPSDAETNCSNEEVAWEDCAELADVD